MENTDTGAREEAGLLPTKNETPELVDLELLEAENSFKTRSSHRSRCAFATLILALIWSIWFTWYMFTRFFLRPVQEWHTASDYSYEPRTAPIAMHWIGGVIVILTGSFQLMQSVRTKWPNFHRWTGRIYLALGCLPSSIGGLVYIMLNGTVGGVPMDIAFSLYGILFLISGLMTYIRIRQYKMLAHRSWALRVYNLGMGSAIYRILIWPKIFLDLFDEWDITILWLNTAGYLMFVPSMIIVEIYLYKKFRSMNGKTYWDSF